MKISTKAEVVGISNYLPYKICRCPFMQTQGYDIKQIILFQDNQGAIKRENDGNKSCN